MPTRHAVFAVGFGFALLLAAGCGPAKLHEEKTYPMDPGRAQILDLPAISKAQTVTVEFTASAGEVYVYLIKDFKEDDGLNIAPEKKQILGEQKGKTGTFSVEVPEKMATRVVIRGATEKADVKLKVTNAK